MKKIISILAVVALMAALLATSVLATDAPQIVVESKTAAAGEEVTLTVSFANNPGITNGSVTYSFDEEKLELVKLNTATFDAFANGVTVMGNPENKTVTFVNTVDFTANIVLFELTFKVKDTAVGEVKVDLTVNYILNNAEEDVTFEVVAGGITVDHECAPVDVAEVPATCLTDGVKAHQECACGKLFVDGVEVTAADLVIPAGEHNLVHVEAVEPGCHMTGNVEHWYCTGCETVWTDEALTQISNHKSVILPATGGEVVHMEAVEPGCHFTGNDEHWYCIECETVWADEALTQITNHLSVIRPAVGGEVIHVEAKEATCYEDGNIEHWYCETCEQVWQDEALTQLTNHMSVKRAGGHDLVHVEAVEPGCHFTGNIEHWYCTKCESVWADEALTQVTNHQSVILPELGGEVIHVEAKAPTCTENGNIEHWYCETCEQVWQDEARTQLTNHMRVVDPAPGHNYVEGVCTVCGEEDKDVPPTGDVASIIFALVAVSGMGLVALTKKKEY